MRLCHEPYADEAGYCTPKTGEALACHHMATRATYILGIHILENISGYKMTTIKRSLIGGVLWIALRMLLTGLSYEASGPATTQWPIQSDFIEGAIFVVGGKLYFVFDKELIK